MNAKLESAAKVLKQELENRTGQAWSCFQDRDYWQLITKTSGLHPVEGRASVSTSPGCIFVSGWYDKAGGGSLQFIHLNLSSRLGAVSIAAAITTACIDGKTAGTGIEAQYEAASTAENSELERQGLENALRNYAKNRGVVAYPTVGRDGSVELRFSGLTLQEAEFIISGARNSVDNR